MLRYKTETRPGLVALYDIRPGNGAGPFLQPRSPHGALILLSVYSGTCLPTFIEIDSYFTDTKQKTSWHVFETRVDVPLITTEPRPSEQQ